MAVVVLPVAVARAHQDPPACTGINVASGLTVTRFDGISDTSEGVTDCETVKVTTDLSWVSNCLISGGTFKLTVADPTDINNPAAEQELASTPVGCLGNATQNLEGCSIGQPITVGLGTVTFTVRPQDAAAGFVVFRARWVDGILHQTPSNVTGQANLRTITVPVINCEDGAFCNGTATCDPDAESEGRKGWCVPPADPDPCPDTLFCADVVCNEVTDSCDTIDTSATVCPGIGNECADITCNEATDHCDSVDNSANCDDQNACTTETCVAGQCQVVTDPTCVPCVTDGDCDDQNVCTTESCVANKCEYVVTDPTCEPCVAPGDCNDQNGCTADACVENRCEHVVTDPTCEPCIAPGDCNDQNGCTADACVGNQCEHVVTDPNCEPCTTPGDCNDQDACTADSCVANKCEHTLTNPTCVPCVVDGDCDDQNNCTADSCVNGMCAFVVTDPSCMPCVFDNECNDGNLCTLEHCDPDRGCVSDGTVECTSNDPCHPLACEPATGQCVERDGTTTVFLVKTQGRFGNGADIRAGIGANNGGGLLRLGRYVVVSDGSAVSGDTVSLGNEANVDDVFANKLLKGQGVKIRGIKGTPVLPLTAPYCPIPSITCGAAPVVISSGDSRSLTPGDYGNLLMQNGASLTLAPGTYSFCSIRTGRNVTIQLTGAAKSTINVLGKIRFANGSTVGPVSGTPTPMLNVAGTALRIGAGTTVRALISAPNALLSMGRGSHVLGTFCVLRSRTDKNIILECPPDSAAPSPSGAFLE